MILQGAAVTLRLHVGGTLVMELEEMLQTLFTNKKFITFYHGHILRSMSGFISFSCLCLYVLFTMNLSTNKCFQGVNWWRLSEVPKQKLEYEKQ